MTHACVLAVSAPLLEYFWSQFLFLNCKPLVPVKCYIILLWRNKMLFLCNSAKLFINALVLHATKSVRETPICVWNQFFLCNRKASKAAVSVITSMLLRSISPGLCMHLVSSVVCTDLESHCHPGSFAGTLNFQTVRKSDLA